MYNDKLVYKVVIWVLFGISLWKEKETLNVYEVPSSRVKSKYLFILGKTYT